MKHAQTEKEKKRRLRQHKTSRQRESQLEGEEEKTKELRHETMKAEGPSFKIQCFQSNDPERNKGKQKRRKCKQNRFKMKEFSRFFCLINYFFDFIFFVAF